MTQAQRDTAGQWARTIVSVVMAAVLALMTAAWAGVRDDVHQNTIEIAERRGEDRALAKTLESIDARLTSIERALRRHQPGTTP